MLSYLQNIFEIELLLVILTKYFDNINIILFKSSFVRAKVNTTSICLSNHSISLQKVKEKYITLAGFHLKDTEHR
jgi:uncharacterized membrane protein (DUF485 family)